MSWERAGNIGARMRDLRDALGKLQEDFAEDVGVTGQSISDYETGRSRPSKSRLVRLAKKVGIPVAAFEEGGPMPSTLLKRPLTPRSGSVRENGAGSYQAPPEGSLALKVLEAQVHAATLGGPVTITQLDYWLELVRKAATSGGADDERRAKHERVVERHRQVQADKARSAQQRPPAQPKRGRG